MIMRSPYRIGGLCAALADALLMWFCSEWIDITVQYDVSKRVNILVKYEHFDSGMAHC